MKINKKFACAIALMLSCLPLAACSKEADDNTETEVGGVETTFPEEIPEIPETPELPEESSPSEGNNPEETPGEEDPTPLSATYILVNVDGLNVRSGAGTGYSVIAQAEKSTLLQYGGTTGEWYKTYYKNSVAYVSAKSAYTRLVSMEAGSDDVESVIEEGLKLLGTPYVYGAVRYHDGLGNLVRGFTVSAFDCSSLMQYMFYQGANVLINVTSRTQSLQGQEVSRANLQRGDLMFFTNASRYDNTGLDRIGHVGMYLGDNYILHTASDFAKIEQISSTRWSYYITARRFL